MIQEIITLIIVFLAVSYTLYSLYRVFIPGKKNAFSCAGSCSSCSLKMNSKYS